MEPKGSLPAPPLSDGRNRASPSRFASRVGLTKPLFRENRLEKGYGTSEGVGFEPTVRFPVRLISSQVPSTAQPPFLCEAEEHSEKVTVVEGE